MSAMPTFPPVPAVAVTGPDGQRLPALDAVRGLALLGILMMNMEAFNGPLLLSMTGIDPRWSGIDYAVDALVYVLVQGKFFPLFSLLFGIGYGLMSRRVAAAGQAIGPLHLRRMLALLVIGAVHAVLLWSGDILLIYALLGLMLPAFDALPRRWLGVAGALGVALAACAMLLLGGLYSAMAASSQAPMLEAARSALLASVDEQWTVYAGGSYWQACVLRLGDVASSLQALLVAGAQILGLFVVGMWLVHSGALDDCAGHARLWRRLRWVAWPLGLAVCLLGVSLSPYMPLGQFGIKVAAAQVLNMIGGSLMGIGYLAWGVHAAQLLAPLAAAGRMSLSTYLGQSLVCTLVFYGYGLGWFGQFSRLGEVLFALALFALQVLFAHVWLRHFRQGPVEWLWRAATYGRWPALRRQRGHG
jgi:uncharacterized protein